MSLQMRSESSAKQDDRLSSPRKAQAHLSYDIAINDRKHLQRHRWKYLVVDEAHRLKNMNCRLINELRQLHSDNRLLLTGTPLQNNLSGSAPL